MLNELQWPSLKQRRAEQKLTMLYKIRNGLVEIHEADHGLLPLNRKGRHNNSCSYRIPRAYKDIYKNSFFPSTVRMWNGLPEEVVTCSSLEQFKTGVKLKC